MVVRHVKLRFSKEFRLPSRPKPLEAHELSMAAGPLTVKRPKGARGLMWFDEKTKILWCHTGKKWLVLSSPPRPDLKT